MAVSVNSNKKWVFYGRSLTDFYKISKSCIIGVKLGVLGQRSSVTKGLNIKIQKHFLSDIKHNKTQIQNLDLYVKALL